MTTVDSELAAVPLFPPVLEAEGDFEEMDKREFLREELNLVEILFLFVSIRFRGLVKIFIIVKISVVMSIIEEVSPTLGSAAFTQTAKLVAPKVMEDMMMTRSST